MKIAHWSHCNGSGLAAIAEDISLLENESGVESVLINCTVEAEHAKATDADIHVMHGAIPPKYIIDQKVPVITLMHGSPEYMLDTLAEDNGVPPKGNSWAYAHALAHKCAAVITFWERHARIWETFTDKPIYKINMGIRHEWWRTQPPDVLKQPGYPACMTAENSVRQKWAVDLMLAWPFIEKMNPEVRLNIFYIPLMQNHFFYPILYGNKSIFSIMPSNGKMSKQEMRRVFQGMDYYFNLVRYGDFNTICLEARAAGCKVISYAGNPYANYWIDEGDQLLMAQQINAIFKGWAEPRINMEEVPHTMDMVEGMLKVYKEVLNA